MKIRKATIKDFKELYQLGLDTPEFQVSLNEPFMDKDDFKFRIKDKNHLFLLAEEDKKIVGFILFNLKDRKKPVKNKYACLVYLVVLPKFRGKGIASQLYNLSIKKIKKEGITHVYAIAFSEGKDEMISFLKKRDYAEGHKYTWMDKKI